MHTIYKTLLQDNLLNDNIDGDLLLDIVRKHFPSESNKPGDAQGVFKDICEQNGWCEPSEDTSVTAVEEGVPIYKIILNDGTKAGMVFITYESCGRIIPSIHIVAVGNKTVEELINESNSIWEKISEEKGQNISYCESMDMELFDTILGLLSPDRDNPENGDYRNDNNLLASLHFYAESGRILPKSLEKASIDEIIGFIDDNRKSILEHVDAEMEPYRNEFLNA